jgi:hypothetical protein
VERRGISNKCEEGDGSENEGPEAGGCENAACYAGREVAIMRITGARRDAIPAERTMRKYVCTNPNLSIQI